MGHPAEKLRPATYADLEAVPSHQVAEILEDTLYAFPRPAPKHAFASSRLGGRLDGPFGLGEGGPGGWILLDEPELHLGADVIVPDLAGWRVERMPELPETAYFTLAPDWICEVLSPSTAGVDRVKKMPVYAREGVKHVWLLDPGERTLEVFRLTEAGRWEVIGLHGEAERVRAEPFDAIELDLSLLWKTPAPAAPPAPPSP
ncbi:MAG: Uma2 family endonuclease [Polyangiaceae bacterium]|nr:Uma2 family endonuclease [Polyangiaceae bacterium]